MSRIATQNLLLLVIALLALAPLRAALAQTVTLQEGLNGYAGTTDTHSFADSPLGNFGDRGTWAIGFDPNRYMPLMRFAIFAGEGGPVPDGATINAATLSLNKTDGGAAVVEVKRLLRSWNELQANWNVAATGVSWQVAGALGTSDIAATADGQGSIAAAAGWYDIDVTASVRAFAAGTPNLGWRLGQVSGDNTNKTFIARDNTASPSLRPKLTISYATAPACDSGALRPYDGAPIGGNPIAVAASGTTTFEAEHFNCGGEGVAYHDLTTSSNVGQTFRATEGVEIIAVNPSGLAVNQFDINEWMTYSIDVAANGTYDLGILASSSASGGGTGAFRIEIDDVDVTGSISVPVTTGWDDYQWVNKPSVSLTAGSHVLKLVALGTYFRTDKLRIVAVSAGGCNAGVSRPYSGTPVNGNAIQIPSAGATWEAEFWNCGGESAGYHELSAGNNAGQTFRADESVEVIAAPSGLAVNQFAVDEWMAYSINVLVSSQYDIGISASASPSGGANRAFRIEIDGQDVTGTVIIPDTPDWDTYVWTSKTGVSLSQGVHELKLWSVTQSFRVDQLRVLPTTGPTGAAGGADDCTRPGLTMCARFEAPPDLRFACVDFTCPAGTQNQVKTQDVGGADLLWFALNKNSDLASDTTRIGRANVGRDGSQAIQFTTQNLDDNVHGSGDCSDPKQVNTCRERSMIQLPESGVPYGGSQGADHWWAHSVMFPAGFQMPPIDRANMLLMEFNSLAPSLGDPAGPNVSINVIKLQGTEHTVLTTAVEAAPSRTAPAPADGEQFYFRMGAGTNDGQCIGDGVQTGVWYDFIEHIKWAGDGHGTLEIWLKTGNGQYIKVAEWIDDISTLWGTDRHNFLSFGLYHSANPGATNSVIHDRYRLGNSFDAVAIPGFSKPPGGVGFICPGMQIVDKNGVLIK